MKTIIIISFLSIVATTTFSQTQPRPKDICVGWSFEGVKCKKPATIGDKCEDHCSYRYCDYEIPIYRCNQLILKKYKRCALHRRSHTKSRKE